MTSTRHRSFSTTVDKEPITFDVDGEEFTAVPDLPGGVLLDIAQTLMKRDFSIEGLNSFFNAAIVPDDHERFAKMIRKEAGPGLDVLVDITKFLVEEYTGFPTVTLPGSPPPPSRTGTGSSARPRSRASTSKSSQRSRR